MFEIETHQNRIDWHVTYLFSLGMEKRFQVPDRMFSTTTLVKGILLLYRDNYDRYIKCVEKDVSVVKEYTVVIFCFTELFERIQVFM